MSTAGSYSSSTNYGAGPGVPPAGANQALGTTQQGSGTTFWSPSKYAMIVDSRLVPGMTVPSSPLDAGNPQYIQPDPASGPHGTTLGETMNNLLQMGASADPASIQAIQDQLVSGGFLDPTKKGFNYGAISGTSDPTYSAWYQLMETAIRTGTDYNAILQARVARDAGKKYEDALALQQAKLKKQQKLADDALLPKTVNRTATQISDPLTAQNLMTTTLTNELGRAPTSAELTQFTQALQTAQAANPTMTTAVTDPGQVQDKSAVQTGGFDPQQFTDNYINQNFSAEKSAVGGATGFYQAALDTLGAGGRGY